MGEFFPRLFSLDMVFFKYIPIFKKSVYSITMRSVLYINALLFIMNLKTANNKVKRDVK